MKAFNNNMPYRRFEKDRSKMRGFLFDANWQADRDARVLNDPCIPEKYTNSVGTVGI